uniref:Core-binding (CB) domain-containing protein n=1 Tax=Xenopus tropicalis TaxID=8364 RepID=A0A803KD74_XENTR
MLEKKTGVFRPVLDLRELNQYLVVKKFKMKSLYTIIPEVRPGGLDDFNRFKGCLPAACANRIFTSKVSSFHGRIPSPLPVHMFAIRPGNITKSILKSSGHTDSRVEEKSNQHLLLFRRHLALSKRSSDVRTAERPCDHIPTTTWVDHKLKEEPIDSFTRSHVLGGKVLHRQSIGNFARREKTKDKTKSTMDAKQVCLFSKTVHGIDWTINVSDTDDSVGEMESLKQNFCLNGTEKFKNSLGVVAIKSFVKRQNIRRHLLGGDDHLCQLDRLGSLLEIRSDPRSLVCARECTPSECQRTKSSGISPERFWALVKQQAITSQNGQHDSNVLHKETGRHKKHPVDASAKINYAMGARQSGRSISNLSSREGEQDGRFLESESTEQTRVGNQPADFRENGAQMGSTRHRSDGNGIQQESETVLFQNVGTESEGDGCVNARLEFRSPVCVSANSNNTKGIEENKTGTSRGNSSHSRLAKKAVVSATQANDDRGTKGATIGTMAIEPGTSTTSTGPYYSPQGMAFERTRLRVSGLSSSVIETMMNARKGTTYKTYQKTWKVFMTYLQSKEVTIEQFTIVQILDFLQKGLEKGLSMRTLKVKISAISAFTGKAWRKNLRSFSSWQQYLDLDHQEKIFLHHGIYR